MLSKLNMLIKRGRGSTVSSIGLKKIILVLRGLSVQCAPNNKVRDWRAHSYFPDTEDTKKKKKKKKKEMLDWRNIDQIIGEVSGKSKRDRSIRFVQRNKKC